MIGEAVHSLVESILRDSPSNRTWSEQGLGMLRTYLDDAHVWRLHVWDSALRIPDVSPIHDHPWDMQSYVIAGILKQTRFEEISPEVWDYAQADKVSASARIIGTYREPEQFNEMQIECGENAHPVGEQRKTWLAASQVETVNAGEDYTQRAEEIHFSFPMDGTVTLVRRSFKEDRDHARVFWLGDGPFVDAKPHVADPELVARVCQAALLTWFR